MIKKGHIIDHYQHCSFSSYRQAQATVLEAVPRLHKLGIKTKRPEDYFAEMAKTDSHMKKVSYED